jgi:hypothetical protein
MDDQLAEIKPAPANTTIAVAFDALMADLTKHLRSGYIILYNGVLGYATVMTEDQKPIHTTINVNDRGLTVHRNHRSATNIDWDQANLVHALRWLVLDGIDGYVNNNYTPAGRTYAKAAAPSSQPYESDLDSLIDIMSEIFKKRTT